LLVVAVGLVSTVCPRALDAQETEAALSRLNPANPEFDLQEWGLQARWRHDVVRRSKRQIQKVHFTGSLVVAETPDDTIYVFNAGSGSLRGALRLRAGLDFAPTELNEQEIILVVGDVFYRLNLETNELSNGWRMEVAPLTRPLVHTGNTITTDGTSRVASMDIEEKVSVWTANAHGTVMERPQLTDGVLYAAGFRGELLCLDAAGGTRQWSWKPPEPAMLSTGVAVKDGMAYVGDLHGYVYALDTDNAQIRWRQIAVLALTGQPVAANDKVLFLSTRPDNPSMVCMDTDAEVDRVAWKMDGITRIVTTGRERAYVLDEQNVLKAVDLDTGEVAWADHLGSNVQVTGGEPGTGALYLANRTGDLAYISERQD
jgi:outer membrane protein assembly factor BamB